jgi:hypothetical protein
MRLGSEETDYYALGGAGVTGGGGDAGQGWESS